jgi:L-amino acid N-acyltransferase YncA
MLAVMPSHDASKPFTLRRATPDDLPALTAIFGEVVEEGDAFAEDVPPTASSVEAYWWGRGGEQWCAVDERAPAPERRVVGGYTLRPNHVGRGAHVATATYLVRRDARGRGLGRRLGAHSIERAGALGFAAMQFNLVVSANTAAVETWRRLGFRTLARVPAAFAHPTLGRIDALILFRALEPSR